MEVERLLLIGNGRLESYADLEQGDASAAAHNDGFGAADAAEGNADFQR